MSLLDGFVVVEFAHPLTEYAGHVLAGLGATVWLVEPSAGSDTRQRRPFANGASESRKSIPFLARNLNKKSVAIDRNSDADLRLLQDLLCAADVVLDASTSEFHAQVESARPGRLVTVTDDMGLGSSSIVGFAASGGLSSSGWPHQPPCNAPSWLALDAAGIYAAGMAIAACFVDNGSEPIAYDIPYAEAALAGITPWTRPLHSYGMVVSGQGAASARLGAGPYPILRCRDGFIRVLTARGRQWDAWLELLGHPEALASDEWNDGRFRAANFEVMVAIASEIVADRSVDDLFKAGQSLGLTITPVLSLDAVMSDEHVQARQLFTTVLDPDLGAIQVLRPPVRLPNAKPQVPAPSLGQHSDEAAAFVASHSPALERSADSAANGTRDDASAAPHLPLAGIRVLEFGVGAVVPEAASMMALLGAEVIKVESRHHLDFLRQLGLNGPGDFNNCPSFNQMNLGVKSIAVDLRSEEGQAVARGLVAGSDVVMENMRGPVMAKFGLDYESVRKIRPDIVYLSSQGLGSGPYGGFQTFGPNLQTFAGVTSVWAHPDDPHPVGSTLNHPDHLAGKQALVALLAALKRRAATGEGCYLDCAQFEAAAALIGDKFLAQQLSDAPVLPLGNRSLDFAPHGCYPCLGEDQWCAIAVETDEQWATLAHVVGGELENRNDLQTAGQRLLLADSIDPALAAWTRSRTPAEAEETLRAAGVPVSRVVTGDDLAAREDWHVEGLFQSVPHPTAGARWHTGLPVRERGRGRLPVLRAPLLGEHDQEIYLGAGLSTEQISQFAAAGTIGY